MARPPARALVENEARRHFALGAQERQVALGQQVVALHVLEHQVVAVALLAVCAG